MSLVERLTEKLLQDRVRQVERDAARRAEQREFRRERPIGSDFDPFEATNWKLIAGTDPGYLPKTPMREGKAGFYIHCKGCNAEFESKGWAYCPTCMALPAEERHAMQPAVIGRMCQAPGCEIRIPRSARADTAYCSRACRERAHRARQRVG